MSAERERRWALRRERIERVSDVLRTCGVRWRSVECGWPGEPFLPLGACPAAVIRASYEEGHAISIHALFYAPRRLRSLERQYANLARIALRLQAALYADLGTAWTVTLDGLSFTEEARPGLRRYLVLQFHLHTLPERLAVRIEPASLVEPPGRR